MSYETLISEKEHMIEGLKRELALYKHNACKFFRDEFKTKFKILDYIVLFVILMNIGAICLTNALVIKAKPTAPLYEANPVNCDKFNCVASKWLGIIIVLKEIALRGFLVYMYVSYRNAIYSNRQYYLLLGIVLAIGTSLTIDFSNDLGFWIGKAFFS